MDTLGRLAQQAARNRSLSQALRQEIRAVMARSAGLERLTGALVLTRLARRPLPSLRSVQEHMKEINAESSASR